MKSLLIVAHGSRKATSNEEVRMLSQRVATQLHQDFDIVDCAFLELAEPSIPQGIIQCATKGSKDIFIFPYFLSAGRHVVEDIPNEIECAREQLNPDINIQLIDYLGSLDSIAGLIAQQAKQS